MTTIRLAALIAALAHTLWVAPAISQSVDGKSVLQCEGAFAKDTSHARLMQLFGKSSVAFANVEAPMASR